MRTDILKTGRIKWTSLRAVFGTIMSGAPWVITETEMRENDIQFSSLNPVNGFVSGEQARPLFMKSGLSPAVLAQDGKMDRFEFSIAMHLIRAVLAGATLPPTLPISLK
ncbi:unnamed protein product, partial [Onchocerca flexuosa]|uniref:EH domain-containing protein n=1 Tax=Onchocerca flexuosa TaxID=387005 RepID=A0A183HC99_9BILA